MWINIVSSETLNSKYLTVYWNLQLENNKQTFENSWKERKASLNCAFSKITYW